MGSTRRAGSLLDAAATLRDVLGRLTLPLEVDGSLQHRAEAAAITGQLDDYILPRLRSADAPLLVVVGGSTGAGKSTLINSVLGATVSRSGVLRPTTRAPVLVHHPADAAWFATNRILPGLARVTGPGQDSRPLVGAADAGSVGSRSTRTAVGSTTQRSGAGDTGISASGNSAPGGRSRPSGRRARATTDGLPSTGRPPGGDRITTVRLVASDSLPAGLALLDAPDIDSVASENRELAAALLAAADLWLFVTTAARYADAVPWEFLSGAAARHASVAIVLNRVPPDAAGEIYAHLRAMLVQRDLAGAPLFTIAESTLTPDGLLPHQELAPVRGWLAALAEDAGARADVVRRTLTGAVDAMLDGCDALARASAAQAEAAAALAEAADAVYAAANARISDGLADGTLLRGEVLARWQELVGTGEWMRSLQTKVGQARDRLAAAATGRPRPHEQVGAALQSDVQALLASQAELAADEAFQRWRTLPGGAALTAAHPELAHSSGELSERVARTVRDWQLTVLDLVRNQGQSKKVTARVLSYGVNGLGVALMLVVFSQTAGLTGAEFGIAGGTAVLAQRVLEAVFGDQAVRTLAARARADLQQRGQHLLEDDRGRLDQILAAATPAVPADELTAAIHAARRVA